MPKFRVVSSTLLIGRTKHRRGDIIETDVDYGTRVELYTDEPAEEETPKRRRRTKAEMEAASSED